MSFYQRIVKPKDDQPRERSNRHLCPHDFERWYLSQYDLPHQEQIRRWRQDEVLRIRDTHGLPGTESPLVGPPADAEAQINACRDRFVERKCQMQELAARQSGRDRAAGSDA